MSCPSPMLSDRGSMQSPLASLGQRRHRRTSNTTCIWTLTMNSPAETGTNSPPPRQRPPLSTVQGLLRSQTRALYRETNVYVYRFPGRHGESVSRLADQTPAHRDHPVERLLCRRRGDTSRCADTPEGTIGSAPPALRPGAHRRAIDGPLELLAPLAQGLSQFGSPSDPDDADYVLKLVETRWGH